MTTSTITTWESNRDEIIKSALEIAGGIGEGQSLSPDQIARAVPALNNVISLFVADGMPLWNRLVQYFQLIEGQRVYSLTDALQVRQVLLTDINGGVQYELMQRSLYDFNRLPDNAVGTPVNYTVLENINSSDIVVWPTANYTVTTQKVLAVVYQSRVEVFNSATDTPDFPAYFNDAIIYALASRLAPRYGLPLKDRQLLKQEAAEFKAIADAVDVDASSMFIQPDWYGMRN